MRTLAPLFLLLLPLACGGGDATPDAAPDAPPDAPSACSACTADQDCLAAIVTRAADDANLPWNLFPGEADGVGTLALSVQAGTTEVTHATVPDVDMTGFPARQVVELGCLAPQTYVVIAYLDDNGDGSDSFSTDFHDACTMVRQPLVQVPAGGRTEIELVLANSCD